MNLSSWRVALPIKIRTMADFALRSFGRPSPPTCWVPLAQIEDKDDSPFPVEEQLWPSRMRTMVQNFDAMKYRPPVIRADGGPAHFTGEFEPPCGFVTAIDFDGVTLWGRFTQVPGWTGGRVDESVSDGLWGRSIGFWYAYGGQANNFKLRHVALLGGEPEGQMDQGLPPLTRYFQSSYANLPGGGAQEATRADSTPFAVRSFTTRQRANVNPSQEDFSMNDTDLRALLDGLATRTASEALAAVTAAVQPLQEQLATVSGTVATLQADLTASRAETTAAKEAAAAAVATQQAEAKRSKEAGYRSRLSALTTSFRVAEGEIPQKVEILMALPDELAEKEIAALAAREPAVSEAGRTVLTIADGAATSSFRLAPGIEARSAEAYFRTAKTLPKDAAPEARATAFARAGMVNENGFLN